MKSYQTVWYWSNHSLSLVFLRCIYETNQDASIFFSNLLQRYLNWFGSITSFQLLLNQFFFIWRYWQNMSFSPPIHIITLHRNKFELSENHKEKITIWCQPLITWYINQINIKAEKTLEFYATECEIKIQYNAIKKNINLGLLRKPQYLWNSF